MKPLTDGFITKTLSTRIEISDADTTEINPTNAPISVKDGPRETYPAHFLIQGI